MSEYSSEKKVKRSMRVLFVLFTFFALNALAGFDQWVYPGTIISEKTAYVSDHFSVSAISQTRDSLGDVVLYYRSLFPEEQGWVFEDQGTNQLEVAALSNALVNISQSVQSTNGVDVLSELKGLLALVEMNDSDCGCAKKGSSLHQAREFRRIQFENEGLKVRVEIGQAKLGSTWVKNEVSFSYDDAMPLPHLDGFPLFSKGTLLHMEEKRNSTLLRTTYRVRSYAEPVSVTETIGSILRNQGWAENKYMQYTDMIPQAKQVMIFQKKQGMFNLVALPFEGEWMYTIMMSEKI